MAVATTLTWGESICLRYFCGWLSQIRVRWALLSIFIMEENDTFQLELNENENICFPSKFTTPELCLQAWTPGWNLVSRRCFGALADLWWPFPMRIRLGCSWTANGPHLSVHVAYFPSASVLWVLRAPCGVPTRTWTLGAGGGQLLRGPRRKRRRK